MIETLEIYLYVLIKFFLVLQKIVNSYLHWMYIFHEITYGQAIKHLYKRLGKPNLNYKDAY